MTSVGLPLTARDRALFLDVDGTLIEHAESPDAVYVPARLKDVLARLAAQEQGALALISGRSIARLDELFAPLRFPAAGLHGLERRDGRGVESRARAPVPLAANAYARARAEFSAFVARHPGLLFEDKGTTLALHYRRAPNLVSEVSMLMAAVLGEFGADFQLQPGKCVIELKPRVGSKRTAIEAFMGEAPFRGRLPIFVGDDLTDEDGFEAVNLCGGDSIRVGTVMATKARWCMRDVNEVIDWLAGSVRQELAP